MSLPTWAQVQAVDWQRAPDDWEHVALASYADQLPEYWEPGRGHAAVRQAVQRYLERHRAAVRSDYPRSQLFRGMRGRARKRRQRLEGAARERMERREKARRSVHALQQTRDGLGRYQREET